MSHSKSGTKKRGRLPKALLGQLATRPDQDLADAYGVPVEQVRRERMLRGLARAGRPRIWTEAELALLGTASDAEIAARVGVTPTAAKQQRRRLGIPPYGPSMEQRRHKWTKQQLRWLGKVPDKEIAERLGISPAAVGWQRRLLGLGPVKQTRRGHPWTEAEIALLGKVPDTEVARQVGIHRHRVALKRRQLGIPNPVTQENEQRWTPERMAKVGKVSNRELAEEMGVSMASVAAYRYRHQTLRPLPGDVPRKGKSGRWQRAHVERLGTVPDSVLAEELGLTRQAVALVRQRLGIAAFHARGR